MFPREIYFVTLGAVTQAGLVFLLQEGSEPVRACGMGTQVTTSRVSVRQKVCLTRSSPVSSLTTAAK